MPKEPTEKEIAELKAKLQPAIEAAVPIVAHFMQAVELYRYNEKEPWLTVSKCVDGIVALMLTANKEGWLD